LRERRRISCSSEWSSCRYMQKRSSNRGRRTVKARGRLSVRGRPPTATPFTGEIEGNFILVLNNFFRFSELRTVFDSLPGRHLLIVTNRAGCGAGNCARPSPTVGATHRVAVQSYPENLKGLRDERNDERNLPASSPRHKW